MPKESLTNQAVSGDAASKDESNRGAQRRRVIRAVAGVPVILTLANRSAWANVSAFQCLTNVSQAQPTEPQWTQSASTPPSTDWVWYHTGNTNPLTDGDNKPVTDPNTGQQIVEYEWKLARFSEFGDPSGEEGFASTASCLTSFM